MESSTAFFSSTTESTASSVNWMIENRGGMAKVFGLIIVPAQFMGLDYNQSKKVIDKACDYLGNCTLKKISFNLNDEEILSGVICYPKGWDKSNKSECIVYHNPNGIALARFFDNGKFSHTPAEIFEIRKCPIILYDFTKV